jgi:hypothetical protein
MKPAPPVSIRMQLRDLTQLYNSMDPSPFLDRDLDADAEEFIVSWARETHHAHPLELTIHLAAAPSPERAAEVETAVQHYFANRAEMKQREFRQLMKRGRMSLLVGSLFLISCLVASDLLAIVAAKRTLAAILKESLTIVGWVAMWRPLEIYLYDWWPLRAERRVLERLSRMRVRLIPLATHAMPATSNSSTKPV